MHKSNSNDLRLRYITYAPYIGCFSSERKLVRFLDNKLPPLQYCLAELYMNNVYKLYLCFRLIPRNNTHYRLFIIKFNVVLRSGRLFFETAETNDHVLYNIASKLSFYYDHVRHPSLWDSLITITFARSHEEGVTMFNHSNQTADYHYHKKVASLYNMCSLVLRNAFFTVNFKNMLPRRVVEHIYSGSYLPTYPDYRSRSSYIVRESPEAILKYSQVYEYRGIVCVPSLFGIDFWVIKKPYLEDILKLYDA